MPRLDELALLIQSRYPLIVVETFEEHRLEKALEEVASSLRMGLWVWTATTGLAKVLSLTSMYDTQEPLRALAALATIDGEGIFLMKDLHPYFSRPEVVRKVRDLAPRFTADRRAIVLSGARVPLPPELAPLAASFALGLPGPAELKRLAERLLARLARERPVRVELEPGELDEFVERLRGLTAFEAERALTRAILRDSALTRADLEVIVEVKRELLRREGVLDYVAPDENLAQVGGFAALKAWLARRRRALEPAARDFGLEPPRGVLLLGVAGCGKTLVARAVAREWALPLLKLEAGRLYDKWVGESEKNLEKALHVAEHMAPCVLLIDEIEKAFGVGSSDDADAGLSRRIVGRLLGWLQDRTAAVFVVATCNDMSRLPPEMTRKGRFDEIFFVDLPGPAERREILAVHLRKRKRDPAGFDLDRLAAAAEGFSGAEIEQAVVSALYAAFAQDTELADAHVEQELRATRPLSVTRAEEVDRLRAWARDRTVIA